jgi:hypothetical protein
VPDFTVVVEDREEVTFDELKQLFSVKKPSD